MGNSRLCLLNQHSRDSEMELLQPDISPLNRKITSNGVQSNSIPHLSTTATTIVKG